MISAAHCATRLRLVLKNEKLADVDGILNTELVKGQFATGGQFQIIIGSGTVDEVYKYFIQYAELQESSKKEVKQAVSYTHIDVYKRQVLSHHMKAPGSSVPYFGHNGLFWHLFHRSDVPEKQGCVPAADTHV